MSDRRGREPHDRQWRGVADRVPAAAVPHPPAAARSSASRAAVAAREPTLEGRQVMISIRPLGIVAVGLVLSTHALESQDRARYRDFRLGGDLASISALTGVAASDAKTIHERPAMLRELVWRRPYVPSGAAPAATDPVKEIAFSFYNDQLSKMVVDYDRDRTAGLTDADLVDAISTEFGPRLKPGVKAGQPPAIDEESGTPMAR